MAADVQWKVMFFYPSWLLPVTRLCLYRGLYLTFSTKYKGTLKDLLQCAYACVYECGCTHTYECVCFYSHTRLYITDPIHGAIFLAPGIFSGMLALEDISAWKVSPWIKLSTGRRVLGFTAWFCNWPVVWLGAYCKTRMSRSMTEKWEYKR